jgi:phage nucleotide-binding protein
MPRPLTRKTAKPARSSTGRTAQVERKLPIKKVSEIKRARSWAIHGRAGSGKTTLSSTFPGPILLLDVKDEGTDSVSDVENLDVMEITEWQDLEDVYWFLSKNPGKYKTVVIDTVTQMQQMIVEEIGSRKKLGGKNVGDWGTMTKSDWGDVASRMKTWISNYRDLPMEVVFLAQERVFNNEDDDATGMLDPEVGPRLSPSVMSHLCAAVSIIGSTFVRERTERIKVKLRTKEVKHTEYCIRLGPSPSYITKIRKPRGIELPHFLVNPTYDTIIELIQGN